MKTVRSWFEVWNAPDGDLEELRRFFDPDVVVIAPDGWPDARETRGVDAWMRQAERLRNTWAEVRSEIDEIRAVGDDRVFAHVRYLTRGADDGIAFDTPISAVFFFRDGLATRAHYFWDKAEALKAAGLAE